MRKGIIVQARLGSTRLPNKMEMAIDGETNLLEYQLASISQANIPITVAMPDSEAHRKFATSLSVPKAVDFFFGTEDNVLKRFTDCAAAVGYDVVMRVCADNPFLNVNFLMDLVEKWTDDLSYSTYFTADGTPAMRTHYGLFAEIMDVKALLRIQELTHEKYHQEHVTPFFYENPALFRIQRVMMPEPFFSGISLRLTVDTITDLNHVKAIVSHVPDPQNIGQLVQFCREQGILERMNEEIVRNTK